MNNTYTAGLNYLQKELELKQNLVGEGFQRAPRDGRNLINIMGEIATAENFDAENIYIQFEFYKPPHWHFDYDDDDHSGFNDEGLLELNRESLVTQQCVSRLEVTDNEHITPVAYFSFPFDWQLTVPEEYVDHRWPLILFQVNSLDSWERFTVEGYGFLEVPKFAGFHEITVQTWKPHASLDARIHSFFLGGSIKVKELKEIADTQFKLDTNQDTILNRFGVTSESSGSIKVHVNVSTQSEELLQQYKRDYQELKHKENLHNMKTKEPEMAYNVEAPHLMQTALGKITRF